MKIIVSALFLCGIALAQTPTISNISVDSLDTTSFRMFYTVNMPAWVEIKYGTSSGVYPYNTKSVNCFDAMPGCNWTQGKGALALSALLPGTTYYVLVTARQDPNDDTNICESAACGAVEQVITTLSGQQPSPPIAPASWVPTPPDTSTYTVISVQVGPSGECVAMSLTSSPDGWTVHTGDTIQTILGEIGYGAVIELPQGAMCKVPSQNGLVGYVLPAKPADTVCGGVCTMSNPAHRWIVFRTHQVTPGDFPPFGARIDPSFAAKLGKFYSSQINTFSQLFDAEAGTPSVHHYWFETVELMDDPNYVNPANNVDPPGFMTFLRLGSQYELANNQFIVLDRVYAHGPGAPIRHLDGYELGGNYMAMIGCYTSKIESWRPTAWPSNPGSVTANNTLLNIPQNNFRLASNSPMLGMTGLATASLSGSGSGTIIGNLYEDHLELQYTGAEAIACSGCSAVQTGALTTPPTAFQLFSGTITNGQFSNISWNTAEWQASQYAMAFGVVFSDLKAEGGPYYFDDNYIDGVGEGFYVDPFYSNFANDDVTYTHNHHIWPKNYLFGSPGNIWRYDVRQHFEMKRGHRYFISGNVFSYSWAYQNDGPAILISGRPSYTSQSLNDGISDVQITSNEMSHLRTGIECSGGDPMDNGGNQNEGMTTKRVVVENNLLFDLGRWKYCDSVNCPSLGSFYFEDRPGCQDLVIQNNTASPTYGDIPGLLYIGGGQLQGNYLAFKNNILHFSQALYGPGPYGDWPANNVSNHDVAPGSNFSNSGPSPDYLGNLNSFFVNIGPSVVPNYSWSNNVLIGGFVGDTLQSATDMPYSQVMALASNMPQGDIYPAGDTMAGRQSTAGLNTTTWESSVYNPLGIGANISELNSALGRVTAVIPPMATGTTATLAYTSPDTRSCAVDVSSDGNTWIRLSDGGGRVARKVTFKGLTNGTTYQSRILCYYQQQNDGVLYTDYTPDEITMSSFATLPSGR